MIEDRSGGYLDKDRLYEMCLKVWVMYQRVPENIVMSRDQAYMLQLPILKKWHVTISYIPFNNIDIPISINPLTPKGEVHINLSDGLGASIVGLESSF